MSHASSESNQTISEVLSDTQCLWYDLDNYCNVIREEIGTHTMSTPLAVEPNFAWRKLIAEFGKICCSVILKNDQGEGVILQVRQKDAIFVPVSNFIGILVFE